MDKYRRIQGTEVRVSLHRSAGTLGGWYATVLTLDHTPCARFWATLQEDVSQHAQDYCTTYHLRIVR